jgi:hypothetical protein
MRGCWRHLAIAALAALAVPETVAACGDKLIVLGRGVRFDRIAESRYPGSIVVFLNPQSRLPAADERFHLVAILELAGHEVSTVASRDELEGRLREKPDLVLADIVDARGLREQLAAGADAPILMPVLYEPTEAEVMEAEALNSCTGQATKRKRRQLLRTVEDLFERRSKGLPTDCVAEARGGR